MKKCRHSKVSYFSTGFTLVRHLLQMPKIIGVKDEPPAITLYSLYMHQLDWYGYQEKMKDEKTNALYPHYWNLESGKVDENKGDTVCGSVIRTDGKGTEVVGLLLKGSKIRLAEQHPKQLGWYKIDSISKGILVTTTGFKQKLGKITGYVWHKDLSPLPTGKTADADQDYQVLKEDNNTVGKSNVKVKGIAVYETADDKQKLTYLPLTATFELDGQENGYAKIRKINACEVPDLLKKEDGSEDAPHKGYVKVTSLTSFTFKPEKFNDIVVLKSPIAISSGDFIGYIGHNQRPKECIGELVQTAISTLKRSSDEKLPQLLHVELFTCDDLPAFITKTRALADRLPESEKKLILVEKGARLIKESKEDGNLNSGLGIKFISDKDNYYIKINLEYTLNSEQYYADNNLAAQSNGDKKIEKNDDNTANKTVEIILTAAHKEQLANKYNKTYPQLTKSDIPDKVELVEVNHTSSSVKIRFCVDTKHYWIVSKDVSHLFGQDGALNDAIPYWNNFPLSLANLPPATKDNTVYFPRTVSLNSLDNEHLIAIEDESTGSIWVNITTGNEERRSITGWVNIKKDAQEHIKRISLWHWQGFETVIEKASVGEFYTKINDNRTEILDIKDYTDSMKAMHKILTQSLLYSVQRKKGLPPFTVEFLKHGLRINWTAEMIGHLIIKYESEWYADEALTKWNEIDNLIEEEKQKQKNLIEKWLDEYNITMPFVRDYALNMVDEEHEKTKSIWQLEKEQRIKPSLWWRKVAQFQPTPQTPSLSNLSADGKAWFIHPVSMLGRLINPGIVTYHIYHDGKIEKHIPQEISKGYEQKYKYVYHDEKNNEHEICICDWHTTKEKANGVVISAPNRKDPNIIEYKENLNEGDTQKRVKFKNGDIAECGRHPEKGLIWRRYKALNKSIEIVRMPDKINYEKDNVIIKYIFSNTKRRYTGPDPLAGFIGALAETGLQLTTTGSCFAEGSCFPSAEHVNGKSVDTLYLNDNDEQKFINAMHKFNFNEQITGKDKKKFDNARKEKDGELHNTHLHSEFKLDSIKEIKI